MSNKLTPFEKNLTNIAVEIGLIINVWLFTLCVRVFHTPIVEAAVIWTCVYLAYIAFFAYRAYKTFDSYVDS